jgi:hypothetical protein
MASLAWGGFFTVTRTGEAWWLVDGSGKPFLSMGPGCVNIGPEPARNDPRNPAYCGLSKYPSATAWGEAQAGRLKGWGANSLGGYSDTELCRAGHLPYAVSLTLGLWLGMPWVDITSEESLKTIDKVLADQISPAMKDDPNLIGYFIDNELGWWDETLFTYWMAQPAEARLKQELYGMLEKEYGRDVRAVTADMTVVPEPKAFTDLKGKLESVAWAPGRRPKVVDRFVEAMAEDYYRILAARVRALDPNHLLLGDRYASYYSQAVATAAGRYMDVVSTNFNTFAKSGWVPPTFFSTLHHLTGRPLIVSEYYFAADENRSGNRNLNGPFMRVRTQRERELGGSEMTARMLAMPFVVGVHWFQFSDEPPKGRADGEDFNFGFVDIRDRPYEGLMKRMGAVYRDAEHLHTAGMPGPCGLANRDGVWGVPRAVKAVRCDGAMEEWNLPATWIPSNSAKDPYLPFGDCHLAWTPEGLAVGLVYWDYGTGSPTGHELDWDRFVVAVAGGDREEATLVITGFGEKVGPAPAKGKPDKRKQAPLRVSGTAVKGFRGGQDSVSITRITEAFMPAAAFGSRKLKAGDTLRVGLSLRLRGDTKVTAWPAGSLPPADGGGRMKTFPMRLEQGG